MNKDSLLKKRSVFSTLIFLFLLLLLPLLLFNFAAIINGNRRLREESLSAYEASITNIADNLDMQFRHIYNLSANIHRLSDVDRLSLFPEQMETYDRITAINFVIRNLSTMKEGNPMIHNIQIYIPALARVLNASGYEHGSMQYLEEGVFDALVMQKNPGSFMSFEGSQASYLITSAFISPRNLVRVTFSPDAVQNTLSLFRSREHEYLMLVTPEGMVLSGSLLPPEEILAVMDEPVSGSFSHEGVRYQKFEKNMDFTGLRLVCIAASESVYYSASRTTYFSALMLVAMLLCILIYFKVTWHLIRQPLSLLITAFHEMETGNLNIRIPEDKSPDFSILYAGFNHMVHYVSQLIERDYRQKILLQKSELKQLQAQINPHFLYNSFFMLQRLIQSEMQPEAALLSRKLGQYFQYVTRNSNEVVFLKDEYQHAKIYMEIQAMRFEKRIRIECEPLPQAYAFRQIPKIILQPILENAFHYGLSNKAENGLITLAFRAGPCGRLSILIEDNGNELSDGRLLELQQKLEQAVKPSADMEMTGLANISRRLLIYSDGKDSILLSRSDLGGLKAVITLEEVFVSSPSVSEWE